MKIYSDLSLEGILNLQKNSTIVGVKSIEVRNFLKKNGSFSIQDINSAFGENKSSALIEHLIKKQWIEQYQDYYRITYTEEVSRFIISKVQKRFSKTEGERILLEIKNRCVEIVNNPTFFYEIDSLILFGSMLNPDSPDVGDLDILIGFKLKPECKKDFSAMVSRDYRDASKIQESILKFLRSGNRKISLHYISEASTVLANGKSYRLIFGNDIISEISKF